MQLLETIDLIFKKRKLKLKLQTYEILSTGENCGLVGFIKDSMSIDGIKRMLKESSGREMTLYDFYQVRFHDESDPNHKSIYKQAINNLADSFAAYSLVCYILQIKDRHNANILIN